MQGTPGIASSEHPRGRRPGLTGWLLLLPVLLWLFAFVVAPTLILLFASFTQADEFTGLPVFRPAGAEDAELTTENYRRIVLDEDGNFLRKDRDGSTELAAPYLRVFGNSLLYAGITTALCVVIGCPVAWHIGRAPERQRNRLLMLVMIPFWTSFLIRTYAWITILARDGLLNGLLQYTRVIAEPLGMLYTPGAVVLGLVYAYLPFMILPVHASVEKIDPSLVDAALDLGARPIAVFRRVIFPLAGPGVAAGVLLVFVPAVGMYAISGLMGGGKSPMIGDVIQNQFFAGRDWPFGSALGMTLLAVFAALFLVTKRLRSGER